MVQILWPQFCMEMDILYARHASFTATANRVQEYLEHLRTCDIRIWSRYAFAVADEEIQNNELQIDHYRHKTILAKEELSIAHELKAEARNVSKKLRADDLTGKHP